MSFSVPYTSGARAHDVLLQSREGVSVILDLIRQARLQMGLSRGSISAYVGSDSAFRYTMPTRSFDEDTI
jgi:hypothetical protein